jgi:hypothetical protein
MQDGRAKKCKMVEQKLNKKCKMAEQKKSKMVEQKFKKKCKMVEQKNARWASKYLQDGRAKKCNCGRDSRLLFWGCSSRRYEGVRSEPVCMCALAAACWLYCGRCTSEMPPSLGKPLDLSRPPRLRRPLPCSPCFGSPAPSLPSAPSMLPPALPPLRFCSTRNSDTDREPRK